MVLNHCLYNKCRFSSKRSLDSDKFIGGGRLIGEVCHFLDLLRYLTETQ